MDYLWPTIIALLGLLALAALLVLTLQRIGVLRRALHRLRTDVRAANVPLRSGSVTVRSQARDRRRKP